MPVSNETSVHAAIWNDKRGTETAAMGPLIPSDHLPFHGNPLDRSGTEEWERDHLPGALKGNDSSQFLPVNGRSVFGMKHMDSSSRVEVSPALLPSQQPCMHIRQAHLRSLKSNIWEMCRRSHCSGSVRLTSDSKRMVSFRMQPHTCSGKQMRQDGALWSASAAIRKQLSDSFASCNQSCVQQTCGSCVS